MARLKFLLFALLVLGLWLADLFVSSPALVARAVELGSAQAQLAPLAVSGRVDARRLEIERAAFKAASSLPLQAALPLPPPGPKNAPGKIEAPSPEHFSAARTAAMAAFPEG